MPKLGIWGAVGGAGAGIMENAKRAAEEQAVEKKSRIDEARERRLLELQQGHAVELTGIEHQNRVNEIGAEGSMRVRVAGAENAGAAQREEDADARRARENELDRQSNERIAGMRATGSASAAEIEAAERFKPVKQSITTKGVGPGGLPTETTSDVMTIYDQETRRTYVQQGNKFVLQGVDPASVRPASAAAMDALRANPDRVAEFLEKYNYLPDTFVEGLPSARTR